MAKEASASAQPAGHNTQATGGAGEGKGGSSSREAPVGATQPPIVEPPPVGATQPSTVGGPAPLVPQPQAAPIFGAYEWKPAVPSEEFNLGLKPGHMRPVPADQAKLSKDIYETKNILKLLSSEGWLGPKPKSDDDTYDTYKEFIKRVKEVADAGCIGPDIETALAADALTQIRADVLRRVGRPVAFRYLHFLALWGLAGALIGAVVEAGASYWTSVESMRHYGLVLVGAMAGAWFGVAVRRWQIAFEELPGFLDMIYEPLIRMVFVAVVALVFALFLDLRVLNITLGSVDLAADFSGGSVETALLLGFIAGMSERAVSKQLTDQVGKALPQS